MVHSPAMNPLALGTAAAYRVAASDPEVDDLAQEAAIAVAEVMAAKPDAPISYLGGVARMRCRKLLSEGRRWTGAGPRVAQALDPLRRQDTASLEAAEEPEAPDEIELVEWAVIGEDVKAALAALTASQRASAVGVAHGMTWAEIGRKRGVSPQSARAAWQSARPHLRASLAHLKGLVA